MNPIALLSGLSVRVWAEIAAGAVLILAAWAFVHHERQVGAAAAQAQLQHERAAVAQAGASAAAAAASETERREARIRETVHAAEIAASQVVADAAGARAERDALRLQLANIRRRAVPSNPAASQGGQDQLGGDPIGVLADVLDRADARAGILAEVADRRRVTAEACERAYEALSHP